MKRCFLFSIAALLALTAAEAQQFPTLERGMAPNKQFSVGDIDAINTFNGNLHLSIPLGSTFPVNGGFSYGLTLSYNSKVWDYEEFSSHLRAVPDRDSVAGMGWTLGFGRLSSPSDSSNTNGHNHWDYQSPDGNRHSMGNPQPGNGNTPLTGNITSLGYTSNNDYLRLLNRSDGTAEVDTPDGVKRTFDAATGNVTKITDPFGNTVNVTYQNGVSGTQCSSLDSSVWIITDDQHRTQYVCFENTSYPETPFGGQMVEKVILMAPSAQTVRYQFAYMPLSIDRGCGSNVANDSGTIPAVPMLASVTNLGDGSSWGFGYNQSAVNGCEQGTLATVTTPTQALISYTYRQYTLPVVDCGTRNVALKTVNAVGVGQKTVSGPNIPTATWTYSSVLNAAKDWVQCSIGIDGTSVAYLKAPSDRLIVTITDPDGNATEHYYSVWPGSDGLYTQDADKTHYTLVSTTGYPVVSENGALMAEYGMPFVRGTDTSQTNRFLSTRIYTPAGYAASMRSSIRKEYVRYEYNPFPSFCTSAEAGCLGIALNQRPISSETAYDDDGGRVADVDQSDFDGFGHYRNTVTGGTFASGNVRTTRTEFNPGTDSNGNRNGAFAFASNSPWILGTFTTQSTIESSHTSVSESCFDPLTGFLKQRRVLLGDGVSAIAVSEDPKDVFVAFSHDGAGNMTSERYFGGDTCGVVTLNSTSCAVPDCAPAAGKTCDALPATAVPVYEIGHGYSNGMRASTQYSGSTAVPPPSMVACAAAPVSFKSMDRIIDPAGVVTGERDPAGNLTTYTYGPCPAAGNPGCGKLIGAAPPGETAVAYSYTNATVTGMTFTPATITATRSTLREESQYDALGRLWREKHKMADGSTVVRETTYDVMGRQQSVSGFETLPATGSEFNFHPVKPKTETSYDSLSRPTEVKTPDGKSTVLSYVGASSSTQTMNVATKPLPDTGTDVSITRNFDRQERLTSVLEGGTLTTYGYDVGSRLSSVSMPGPAGVQTRSFTYDGRGFLTAETHPEFGVLGNGSTTYGEYDARGHAHRRTVGSPFGSFDVRTDFEAAERPYAVKDVATGNVLKNFRYDSGFACAGNSCQGKLAAAERHNYDPDLGDVDVTESYQYDAATGRPARRDRTVGTVMGLAGDTFYFSQSYDSLGNPSTTTYPQRVSTADRVRQLANEYTNGFLTKVSSPMGTVWAGAVSYQPNAMIATITHGTGSAAVSETWSPDPDGMARPAAITANFASGPQWTTGAYSYDGAGNIRQIGATEYTYDSMNRLSGWNALPSAGVFASTTIGYDPFGNQLLLTYASCGNNPDGSRRCAGSSVLAGTIRGTTNHYDGAVYDDAGNVTSDGARTFSYDPLSSMTRAVVAGRDFRYLYSADDERIAAVERVANPGCANKVTFTIRDFANRLLSEWRDDSVSGPCAVAWKEDEIWGGGRLLGNDSPAYGTRHYILDHLGSPRAVADSLGTFIGSQEFAPFGSGGTSNGGALQFTGHERDAANLGGGQVDLPDYMHARFYSAAGRFLSVDPVMNTKRTLGSPQAWNRYAYARNNPLRFIDPLGLLDYDAVVLDQRVHVHIDDQIAAKTQQELKAKLDGSFKKINAGKEKLTKGEMGIVRLIRSVDVGMRESGINTRSGEFTFFGPHLMMESSNAFTMDYLHDSKHVDNADPLNALYGDWIVAGRNGKWQNWNEVDERDASEFAVRVGYKLDVDPDALFKYQQVLGDSICNFQWWH